MCQGACVFGSLALAALGHVASEGGERYFLLRVSTLRHEQGGIASESVRGSESGVAPRELLGRSGTLRLVVKGLNF